MKGLADDAIADLEQRLSIINENLERRSIMRAGIMGAFNGSDHIQNIERKVRRRRGLMQSHNQKYFGQYMRFSFERSDRDLSQPGKKREG